MKQRVKIGLNCIVKNEAKVIERMLSSCIGLIDCYYILDTGSTDGTPDIIRNFFKKHNIQGEVVVDTDCHQEINGKRYFMYDVARNKALQLLKGKCDFGVMIDADEQFVLPKDFNINTFKNFLLSTDKCSITVHYNDSRYARSPIFRVSKPFKWKHPIHELLTCEEPLREGFDPNIYVLVTSDGNSWTSESMKEKYLGHAAILEWAVEQNNDTRDIFYCANSYKDAGEHLKAIEWYEKRIARTDGYFEERYYSQLMIAEMKKALNIDYKEVFFEYMKASDLDNMKAENFINAIIDLQHNGKYELAYILSKYCVDTYHKKSPYPQRALFLDAGTYEWKLLEAHKINCQKTNRGDYIHSEDLENVPLNTLLDSITSAWKGHLDFAQWLIGIINPKYTIELGVDYGYSLFSLAIGNKGQVFGIDSFEGDPHTGTRNTFEFVNKYVDVLKRKHNINNIQIIKGKFNDSIANATDNMIDIIHIDGSPLEIENDFIKWLPKLSSNGVILMHNTTAFGQVKEIFDKIKIPKINFEHSGGLGVISKNKAVIDLVKKQYFSSTNNELTNVSNTQHSEVEEALKLENITLGYISHDESVFNKYLNPSINNLIDKVEVISISDLLKPADNYNKIIDAAKTKYILFVHEDVTFSTDFIHNINKLITQCPDFGAIGAVGVDDNGKYQWGESTTIKETKFLDCCCILINKEHGIRFDNETFDEFHLYVEDYCAQAINKGLKIYTIPTNASEAEKGIGYETGENYFKHHSHTVNERGYCWGNYYEYLKKFKSKWAAKKQDPIEVDVCIISYAKTQELRRVTEEGIHSLIESEGSDIKFNVFVIESNPDVYYDMFPNTITLRTSLEFCYNRYLNIAASKGKAPYVFLANNDLTYEKGWASEIIKQMKANPKILSASPFCPQTQDPSMKAAPVILGYEVRQQLAGWAIFVQRIIFNIIGDLPTDCSYWFSDNDYAMTIQSKKIQHALITNSVVNHHDGNHGATGKLILQDPLLMDEYTRGQYEIFKRKWNLQ